MTIPIVLTGTIIPNVIKIKMKHCDWRKRRSEYIDAIKYYTKFSKVYFLENSTYDLLNDANFSCHENFRYFKFRPSNQFEKGKGYQEFQMLDEFVKHKLKEDCFVKITGRYIYENFDEIFSFILKEKNRYDLIVDTSTRFKKAYTGLFYVKKDVYIQRLQDLYLEMDDSKDIWAEHIIYKTLKNIHSYIFFSQSSIIKRCLPYKNAHKDKQRQKNVFFLS